MVDLLIYLVLAYLYGSFAEWFVHSQIMHKKIKFFESHYDEHMAHHREYNASSFISPADLDPKKRYSNFFICVEHAALVILPAAVLAWFWLPVFAITLFVIGCLQIYLFNRIHCSMHLNHKTFVPEWFMKQCIRNHYFHHKYPGAYFAVAFPGIDYLLNTTRDLTVKDIEGVNVEINRVKVSSEQQTQEKKEMFKENWCFLPSFYRKWQERRTKGYYTPPSTVNFIGELLKGFIFKVFIGKREVICKHNIPIGNYIFVSTHFSWKDLFILSKDPSRRLMIHQEVIDSFGPLSAWFFVDHLRGFVPSIKAGKELLEEGYNLAICPEGVVNPTGEISHFHTGAAVLAKETNTSIVPLYIDYYNLPGNWILQFPVKIQIILMILMPWFATKPCVIVGDLIRPEDLPDDPGEATEVIKNNIREMGYNFKRLQELK